MRASELTDDEIKSQLKAIGQINHIPVMLYVFDGNEVVNEYLVACKTVPRVDETIVYGEADLQVFKVNHKFSNTHPYKGDTDMPDIWIQMVHVFAREIEREAE